MFTCKEVLIELEKLGTEQTKKTLVRHGAPSNQLFGVKVVHFRYKFGDKYLI